MNAVQQLPFELKFDELRRLNCEACDLSGCMLAACFAHHPSPDEQTVVIQFLIESGASTHCKPTPWRTLPASATISAAKVGLTGGSCRGISVRHLAALLRMRLTTMCCRASRSFSTQCQFFTAHSQASSPRSIALSQLPSASVYSMGVTVGILPSLKSTSSDRGVAPHEFSMVPGG